MNYINENKIIDDFDDNFKRTILNSTYHNKYREILL